MGQGKQKNFRKRVHEDIEGDDSDNEYERRLTLEEVKFLQRQRERHSGVANYPLAAVAGSGKSQEKPEADGKKEELVLQDTFAQETAVTVEDPNMLKYVEQELAKKHGRDVGVKTEDNKPIDDDLYVIPEHLKVRRRNSEESSTQWTTGIAEVQLPIEFKLKNIEETEAAKKQLQDRRPFVGRGRIQSNIPASYSADYSQRGREYAEKIRKDNLQVYKPKDSHEKGQRENTTDGNTGNRRQAATDEIMLERFRKRERNRLMRR